LATGVEFLVEFGHHAFSRSARQIAFGDADRRLDRSVSEMD
jgi:hypothetical protein